MTSVSFSEAVLDLLDARQEMHAFEIPSYEVEDETATLEFPENSLFWFEREVILVVDRIEMHSRFFSSSVAVFVANNLILGGTSERPMVVFVDKSLIMIADQISLQNVHFYFTRPDTEVEIYTRSLVKTNAKFFEVMDNDEVLELSLKVEVLSDGDS